MAERVADLEQLLPCLIDRLTDEKPRVKTESRSARGVTVRRYRDGVLRDLNWLLNTSSHPPDSDFYGLENVIESVFNYGVNNLSGIQGSLQNASDIERNVRKAILAFEPRIISETLKVQLILPDSQVKDHDHCILGLEIQGELWLQPLPEQLYIKTEIDLETGQCVFKER